MKVNWYKLIGLNLLNVAITLNFDIERTLLLSTLTGIAMAFLSFERVEDE